MKRHLLGAMVLAGTGTIARAAMERKSLATVSALSPLVALPTIYWRAPHEIAARQFAENKDIQDRYGKIIIYKY